MSDPYEREREDSAYRFHSQVDGEAEPLEDALGQDLFQAYLEVAYANYIRTSTRNLIGHIYNSSPLVGRHRIGESGNES